VLINKSKTENNFIGYLKMADDKIYVKEIDSYLFFPVPASPWQLLPTEKELNEAVTFSLENTDNKEKVTAKLFNNNYIPEFYAAVKLQKAKTPVEATVYRVSPHGIYLNIIGEKIQAKIPLSKNKSIDQFKDIKVGATISVIISYLSPFKIIVDPL
jgi:predicted RNA-binding protein (virulence factor B family)